MHTSTSAARPKPLFPVTRWSVVEARDDHDRGDPAAALEELCRTYWLPLYAAVRRMALPKRQPDRPPFFTWFLHPAGKDLP